MAGKEARAIMTQAPGTAKEQLGSQLQDSRLVQECLKGKESAWSALVKKYKNLIFSIPIRYGFSEEDSADIFQAVCMDLLAELPRLRKPNALAGWLIRVTRNKCFHRKQQQRRHPEQEVHDDDLNSGEESQDLVSQVQQEQLLREGLRALSPRCRQLVLMLFFETPPRPYEQIAKDLRLAPGSIGIVRRRCLDKLGQRLKQMGL